MDPNNQNQQPYAEPNVPDIPQPAPPEPSGNPLMGPDPYAQASSAEPTNYASPPAPPSPPYQVQPQFAQQPSNYAPPTAASNPVQPNASPQAVTNPNSTQNALQIAEIRDGVVIMNDGSFRSVVMVKSINFDLMSPQERESVEYAYQAFLNSLYFDIQIFIRSQKVDLRPYIEKLDKIRSEHDNMLLALLMEDYLAYIDALSMQTNIMDKNFYVVIPYNPQVSIQRAITQSKNFFSGLKDLFNSKEKHVVVNEAVLNAAKDEMRNRVQAVLGGLQQCGIQGLPLDTQELIELYYDTYNPDTATRQQLKNFDDLNAPVVTKGQGMAPQPNLDRELR